MTAMLRAAAPAALTMLLVTGCASDGSSPFGGGPATTVAVTATAPAASSACVALSSRIDALRKDGVTERAAQAAATGKTTTVAVKRASLANLAELDKANADFQARCSTLGPRAVTANPAIPPAGTPSATSSAPAKAVAAKVAKTATAQPAPATAATAN